MKRIEWLIENEEFLNKIPKPKSSKKYVPEWYKKISKFKNNDNNSSSSTKSLKDVGIKSCMPFLDSLCSGYIQETWCDILIKKDENSIEYFWSLDPQILSHREDASFDNNFLEQSGLYKTELVWKQYWMPKLPTGYSMLITHPFNRIDLPFFTTSGIVDSDLFYDTLKDGGNIPFYIKENFEGIIPAGTPMYQMTPIKRDVWNSDNGYVNKYKDSLVKKYFYDGYKKMYWQKKKYLD